MEKLQQEIARKKEEARLLKLKQQADAEKSGLSESHEGEQQKRLSFIRQKDRLAWQQETLERKQKEVEDERVFKRQKHDRNEANRADHVHASSFASSSTFAASAATTVLNLDEEVRRFQQLSNHEIQLKLRSLRQPITLFGEDKDQRIARLLDFLTKQPASTTNTATTTREEVRDDKYRDEVDKDEGRRAGEGADEEDQVSASEDEEDEKEDGGSSGREGANENRKEKKDKTSLRYDPTILFHKMPQLSSSPEKIIYKFFRSLLKQWEHDLHERSEAEKASMKGKLELKTQKQCKDHIRPLFRLCQQKTIPFDIQTKLLLMVTHCEEGNFIKANDEYIKTAIGNSAWPIGLTMVGIHERSGRERISTSKVSQRVPPPFFVLTSTP